jgi:hypothetical protein
VEERTSQTQCHGGAQKEAPNGRSLNITPAPALRPLSKIRRTLVVAVLVIPPLGAQRTAPKERLSRCWTRPRSCYFSSFRASARRQNVGSDIVCRLCDSIRMERTGAAAGSASPQSSQNERISRVGRDFYATQGAYTVSIARAAEGPAGEQDGSGRHGCRSGQGVSPVAQSAELHRTGTHTRVRLAGHHSTDLCGGD